MSREDNGVFGDVSWLIPADLAILRLLNSSTMVRLKLQPANIAGNVGYNRGHIGKRCRLLADAGLLRADDDGYYQITETGAEVAEGTADPSRIEKLNPK